MNEWTPGKNIFWVLLAQHKLGSMERDGCSGERMFMFLYRWAWTQSFKEHLVEIYRKLARRAIISGPRIADDVGKANSLEAAG